MNSSSFFFVVAAFFLQTASAFASPWNLPLDLSDENTAVTFEVDSTWHLVHGRTSGVAGSIQLNNEQDSSSITGEVRIPVASFETASSRRDEKLRSVMESTKFSEVVYTISSAEPKCTPTTVLATAICPIEVKGSLSIHGVTLPWNIPATLRLVGDQYEFKGSSSLRWPEFGVEDPSIFVAKLDPKVKIIISVRWRKN